MSNNHFSYNQVLNNEHLSKELQRLRQLHERQGWFMTSPHVYPPNLSPTGEFFANGKFNRDGTWQPSKTGPVPFTRELWIKYGCKTVHPLAIVSEIRPRGKSMILDDGRSRKMEQTIVRPHMAVENMCFGNCLLCYRTKKRSFEDTNQTRYPGFERGMEEECPRMGGACGCVLCHGCVSSFFNSTGRDQITCPYCGSGGNISFHRDIVIWVVMNSVYQKAHPM